MPTAPAQASGCNLTQADYSASTESAEPLIENHLPRTTWRRRAEPSSLQSGERSLSHRESHPVVQAVIYGGTRISAHAQQSKPLCSLHASQALRAPLKPSLRKSKIPQHIITVHNLSN